MRALGPLLIMVISTFAAATLLGTPEAQAQDTSGPGLYTQFCSSCHQADGRGVEGTFPPLVGNPAAGDPDAVADAIQNGQSGPVEILGVSYDGVMPPVPALSGAQLDAVVAYVVDLSTSADATTATASAPGADGSEQAVEAIVGDKERGHDLFIGSRRLENGGGACVACHTAGSIGNLGGSSLGPDLTSAFDTLGGEAGLTGWLGNPPAPTMAPIFVDRPLNEGEIADLVAYLGTTPDEGPADDTVDTLLVASAAALVVLFGGMAIAWRGMRQTYLQRLRSKR